MFTFQLFKRKKKTSLRMQHFFKFTDPIYLFAKFRLCIFNLKLILQSRK